MPIHQALKNYSSVVVDAGRRFGKSAAAINEGIYRILQTQNQLVWIILPKYKQAKNIYWIDPDISKFYLPYTQNGIMRKNDMDLSLYCFQTKSYLFLKGSDNYDSLRGSGLDLIIWDEPAYGKAQAFDVMRPTLADSPNRKTLYIGSPNGFDHFHDMCLMGDHMRIIDKGGKNIKPLDDYMTFKFTSYDNASFDNDPIQCKSFIDYINKEKDRLYSIGQGDYFEQEYMAEFRKKAGSVHKDFSRQTHLIPQMTLPKEWQRMRGFDFGSNHPTASIRMAIDNDENWFIEKCYKRRDEYIKNHVGFLADQDKDMGHIIEGYGDPTGAQWIKEFNLEGSSYGLSIRPARKDPSTQEKSWIQLGIDKINEKLRPREGHVVFLPNGEKIENAPSFFILNNEENNALINEFESLVYKKDSNNLLKNDIDDTQDKEGHYDLHASLRYLAISIGSGVTYLPIEYKKPVLPLSQAMENAPNLSKMSEEERKKLESEADRIEIQRQNYWR